MTKEAVKKRIFSHGLRCWEIAEALEMSDSKFTRVIRHPTDEILAKIDKAIEAVLEQKAKENA